jgi:hypothetical protein
LTGDYYYILKPSPAIPPVVQLAFGSINPAVNQADTLTWKVLNGYSLTLQQCNAFIMNNAANAGTWSGPQKGSMVSGVYEFSCHIGHNTHAQCAGLLAAAGSGVDRIGHVLSRQSEPGLSTPRQRHSTGD